MRVVGEIDAAGRRQAGAAAQMVIDEQPQAQLPWRAHAGLDRQHETHRPDQMRRHPQHDLALGQRLAHQPEPAVLEIAQPAMDQLGGGGRRAGGEIVLLDQEDAQPPAGRIARDAGAVDASAHDGKIEIRHAGPAPGPVAARGFPRFAPGAAIHSQSTGKRLASGTASAMMRPKLRRRLEWTIAIVTWSSPAGPGRWGPRSWPRWWRRAPSAMCPTCTRPKRNAFRCAITPRSSSWRDRPHRRERGRAALRRRAEPVGLDPSRRRLRHGGGGQDHQGRPDEADRPQPGDRVPELPRRRQCHDPHRRGRAHRQCGGAPGARMAQRAPAWRPMRRARPPSRRSRSRSPRRWPRPASWSMRSRPRSWTRRPTAPPCRKADYAAWPKVEEVAATILFLASPDNKVTRGGVVPVYGRS